MLHSFDCFPTMACGGNWHGNSITSEEHKGQLIVWDQLLTATPQGSHRVTKFGLSCGQVRHFSSHPTWPSEVERKPSS